MPTAVANVRQVGFDGCIYVGRYMPNRCAGHPLGNPFKAGKQRTRQQSMKLYALWLKEPEQQTAILHLARRVEKTGLPLGCYCVEFTWRGEEPAPLCHAILLAKQVDLILEAV